MRGEKISIKKWALVLSVALAFVFAVSAVSAANQTDVITADEDSQIVSEGDFENLTESEPQQDNATQIRTQIKSEDTNVVKGKDFSVRLSDDNDTPISNKTVSFTFKKKVTNATTDENGIARLKIDADPGSYTVKYSFASDGYVSCSNSTDILVISTTKSKIKASDYTAYARVTNKFTVTLTVGGIALENRAVTFKINGKTVTKKTNSKGKATIKIDEAKGTYKLKYYFDGEDNIKPVNGTVKITVKKGMPTKISKYYSQIYRNKKASYFKIKLTDSRGDVLKSKKVTFKVNGRTYTAKTNSKGIAKVKIKLKTGSYKIKVTFKKTSVYKKSSKTFSIKVKPAQARNNGMWLFGKDMYSVNFDKLEKNGFKHIFLNFKALELYGQKKVEKWVKEAKKHKIKVHLWMQVFYEHGKWQNPAKSGKVNMKMINSKVKLAKKYAKIKGIAGVHFDYVRYPGNAYQYKNSIKAVNTFVKKASNAVHKQNKKLIVSAAVMPEPSSMKRYYAQDIPTMGKYLDVIVPMVYKGNYHAGSTWIKWVTKTLSKQAGKAKVWTGLQSYRSDSKLSKIPAKELMGDADSAALAGAYGIILFRYGLFNYINFNEV